MAQKRVVLGESSRLLPYYAGKRELDAFPLAEEMRNLKDKLALNANELIVLNFYLRMFWHPGLKNMIPGI